MGDPGILHFEDENGGTHSFPAIYRQQWEEWMKSKGTRYAELPEGMQAGSDPVIWTQPKPGDVFNDTQYGMIEEDPAAQSGAYDLPRPGTDQPDAGVDAGVNTGVSMDAGVSPGRKVWDDAEAKAAQGPLSPDARTTRQGVDAPLKEGRYSAGESIGRGYLDQAAWGFDDEAAGLGGVYDEMTRDGIQPMPWLDSLLRSWPINADIPFRVDRTVMGEGRKLKRDDNGEVMRFQSTGNPIREPGEREIKSQMAYQWPPDIENYDPARIEATQSLEPVTKHYREPAPRLEGRQYGAEPQGRLLDYADAALDSRKNYSKNNKAAFDEDPAQFMMGSAFAAIPQSALTRRIFPGATSAQEADAAVARAGPGVGKFIERVGAGAKDAVMNRGNLASAGLSAAGHMEGDSLTDKAASFVGNAAMELGTGALGSLFAEMLLNPARKAGRGILARLEDSFANPDSAHTLITARNAGAEAEFAAKPEGKSLFGAGRETSEMGVRPGEKMRSVQADLLEGTKLAPEPRTPAPMPGDVPSGTQLELDLKDRAAPATRGSRSALVAEELRKKSADNLTMAAETQRKQIEKWINEQKADFFKSDAGKKPIPESVLKEQLRPRSKAWGYIQEHLKTFGGERSNRWTMPPHNGVPGEVPPLPNAAMPEGKRGKYRGLQAIDLDEMITETSDKMKAYKGERPHDQQRYWKDIHDELMAFRERHYKRLDQIALQGHERLNKREANATVLGIPREASPIQTERNSPHAQAIMERLGQFKDNPQIQEAVTNLKGYGANPELSEQAAGALATQQIIGDAQKGNAPYRMQVGPFSANLRVLNPGLRPAGLANLGLNSNAAAGGASREWVQYLAHVLGMSEPVGQGDSQWLQRVTKLLRSAPPTQADRHPVRHAKP